MEEYKIGLLKKIALLENFIAARGTSATTEATTELTHKVDSTVLTDHDEITSPTSEITPSENIGSLFAD